ncbi:CRE-CSR-1 protein [Caenorhabditis remanei]|uniref:CRE-CSR-1 protein n=1 Tax=Caenorhabditis remanei TaxID=31234 RepID=E3M6J3_CAERE|nr:CRE-CSR-1 protein [Caenorhabditis remanei]
MQSENSNRGGRGGGGRGRGARDREDRDPGGSGRGGRGSYRGGRGGSERGGSQEHRFSNRGGRGGRGSHRGGSENGPLSGYRSDRESNGDQRGGRGSHRGDYKGSERGSHHRDDNASRGGYRGRGGHRGDGDGAYTRGGGSDRGRRDHADNHRRPVETNDREQRYESTPHPRLALNIFGLELSERIVFRHVVQMKLLDHKTNKDYILTTMSARGRGNRASKQNDNFILLGKLLDRWITTKGTKKHPVYAYDGAQSLFTLEGISQNMVIQKEDALQIPGISEFLKDSIKFLNGDLEISCEPDLEKPSFVQTEINEWSDPRFYAYLDIVTSQSATRRFTIFQCKKLLNYYSGKYLSQSKGLYVNTEHMEELRVKWAVAAKGIHKGCRIVGKEHPLPILELDPQSTQYYAAIPLSKMIQYAFPRDFGSNRIVNPNLRLQRAVKLLLKAIGRLTPSLFRISTTTLQKIRSLNRNIQTSTLPAAQCGTGPHKRLMPLEYLKVLPFQSIDRRVLEEFELTPRANAPNERWTTLQHHYDAFGFNDNVMQEFGVLICNDPFQNISEIDGERVLAPKIAYADPVHVDDEKRDWKAQDKRFETPATIDHLMFVLLAGYTRSFDQDIRATEFVANAFMQRCRDKGMIIKNYELKHFEGERDSETFLTSVFKYLVTLREYPNPAFIPFVLFVSDDVPNIHECLKFEERMSDIPTQHVLLKNIRKIRDNIEKKSHGGRRAYDLTLDNIVMKANVKCGGLNYTADPPRELGAWKEVPTFVMGMDVAHPDKMASREGNPSTVGLSCNAADNPYSFIGDFLYTDPRREAIQDELLRKFTDQHVRNFAERRGFPKKIIIFRDGVSFGEETEALREVEIIEQTIIAAAKSQGLRDYAPKVLAIVVKKRHHTRFYAKGGQNGNTPTNPLPDTSVGGDIAEYGKRQIFIQAFRPVQGTAKVPSFLILRDDEEVSDESIAKMTCAVCSLHQLVNSPTSIPTPVYVAHELAKRGTGLFKAYRFKNGELHDWATLSDQLSYSTLDRLSKVRVV